MRPPEAIAGKRPWRLKSTSRPGEKQGGHRQPDDAIPAWPTLTVPGGSGKGPAAGGTREAGRSGGRPGGMQGRAAKIQQTAGGEGSGFSSPTIGKTAGGSINVAGGSGKGPARSGRGPGGGKRIEVWGWTAAQIYVALKAGRKPAGSARKLELNFQ